MQEGGRGEGRRQGRMSMRRRWSVSGVDSRRGGDERTSLRPETDLLPFLAPAHLPSLPGVRLHLPRHATGSPDSPITGR